MKPSVELDHTNRNVSNNDHQFFPNDPTPTTKTFFSEDDFDLLPIKDISGVIPKNLAWAESSECLSPHLQFMFTPDFLINSIDSEDEDEDDEGEEDFDSQTCWSDVEDEPRDDEHSEPWKTHDKRSREVIEQMVSKQFQRIQGIILSFRIPIATTATTTSTITLSDSDDENVQGKNKLLMVPVGSSIGSIHSLKRKLCEMI
ncbi:hypothetical protein BY996DRAFT_6409814 [Phakopsora pachyrhizi]|uniref:Expressed protein n=1 Tax=Phakopsora pachyrhizi TaxID=170000 RepID=A0AAV0AV40_PHAPC|nr:hypothetical protein BY996DRAFT_6427062 [Phakopsora pachyrhizi]KAI8459920.1 hypothetical protein BY996DRAFT_6409814 [Phakopsora pachyrhizi]CAH7671906.1 expressed protein [Phakopsora pachyrhizi]